MTKKGKMMKCAVCDKDFGKPPFVGISIQVGVKKNKGKNLKAMKVSLGRYKLNKAYNVCFECWLKSLGVKP